MKKANRKVSIFEIAWYVLCGLIALWGLTFLTFGVIVRHLRATDALAKADASYFETMKINFFNSGLILLPAGVIAAVVVLLIFAKTADREVEKQQRRAARIAAASSASVEAKPKEEEKAQE